MRTTRAIRLERDVLVLTSKKESTALADFIRDETVPVTVIWLNDEADQNRWVLQAQRIKVPSVPLAFGLRIADGKGFLEGDYHAFESFFGFTRQETAICRLKLQGLTVQDIVETEGKSHDTVRFHIRNIYRKVGVSSREELFANLRHFLFS